MRSSATARGAHWLERSKIRVCHQLKPKTAGKLCNTLNHEAGGPELLTRGVEARAAKTPNAVFGTTKVRKSLSVNPQMRLKGAYADAAIAPNLGHILSTGLRVFLDPFIVTGCCSRSVKKKRDDDCEIDKL